MFRDHLLIFANFPSHFAGNNNGVGVVESGNSTTATELPAPHCEMLSIVLRAWTHSRLFTLCDIEDVTEHFATGTVALCVNQLLNHKFENHENQTRISHTRQASISCCVWESSAIPGKSRKKWDFTRFDFTKSSNKNQSQCQKQNHVHNQVWFSHWLSDLAFVQSRYGHDSAKNKLD